MTWPNFYPDKTVYNSNPELPAMFTRSKSLSCYLILLLVIAGGRVMAQLPVFSTKEGHYLNTIGPGDTNAILNVIHKARQLVLSNPDSAMVLLQQTLSGSEQIGYHRGIMRSFIYIGDCFIERKAYPTAQRQYFRALNYTGTKEQYLPYQALIYTQLGNAFQFEGNMEAAVNYYGKAARIADRVKDTMISLSRIYNNLAHALSNMGQLPKAVYYLDKAESVASAEHNNKQLGDIFLNKGVAYARQKNREKAGYYFQAARKHAIKYHQSELQRIATANLGKLLIDKGAPEQAVIYLKEALLLENQDAPKVSIIKAQLGMAYYRAKDYTRAEPYLLKALEESKEAKETDRVWAMEGVLGEFYGSTAQYQKANEHLLAYIKLHDSVKNNEQLEQANKLETQYRTALKDKELSQQQLQINRQKNEISNKNLWITGTSAGVLLLVVFMVLLYILLRNNRQKQKQEQQLQAQYILSLQKDKEISSLKALMEGEEKERGRLARELHDGIGGMLASTKMNLGTLKEIYTEPGKAVQLDIVMQMLTETASEVRKTAHNLMPDVLMRYDLRKALTLYCEGVNTSNQLQVDLEFYGELEVLTKAMELIVYRMAQELIQNIIKHAGASLATVMIMLHENKLSINAEDNGKGFGLNDTTTGFGLQNLRHRVEALHGHIDVQSAEGGPTIIFIAFDFTAFKEMTL